MTATLSHDMDNGSIMFYARELNDKNLFISDIPLAVTGTGKNVSYSAFPGFNPLTGWYAGSGIQGLSVQECPGCAPLTANLADGRGANIHTFGNNLDLDVGRRGPPEQQAAVHERRHADHRHIQRQQLRR